MGDCKRHGSDFQRIWRTSLCKRLRSGGSGFYKIFKRHCSDVVNMLKPYERRFILGEFGLAQAFKQGQNNINGVKMDVCDAFYNGKESYSALQICEMALAAVNAGVYAMALWTFVDVPNPRDLQYRLNKWGLLRWDDTDYGARDWLYAYGLLVRYFRKIPNLLRFPPRTICCAAAAL